MKKEIGSPSNGLKVSVMGKNMAQLLHDLSG
jgi:hypothetical protein